MLLSIAPLVAAADTDSAAKEMVQSEKDFSQTSVDHGIKESFLQFFADDSIIFSPGPENGKQHYTAYTDKGYKLQWAPVFAAIANSADFGITTGPWTIWKSKTEKEPLGYGQFFTVWKKRADGAWKVAFDTGIENPQPATGAGEVEIVPPSIAKDLDAAAEKRALETAEKNFFEALKKDAGAAVLDAAADNIRVLRDETLPATNKAAATIMLSRAHDQIERRSLGGDMSKSADLAYGYGSYAAERGGLPTERGHYVSVWRAEPNGEWKLFVDLQKKDPEPKK